MKKLLDRIKREFTGWKKWQIVWIVLANSIILGVSLYMGDTAIGIVASLTGVTCVILCGMGRVSNYFFGTINVVLYAIVAWKARYYGDVMLNLLYYFPTNIIGWVVWSKHLNQEKNEVYKKRMTLMQDILLAIISAAGVLGYSYILKLLGGNLPIVDSMSTVFSVIAQILMIKRFTEQWVIWIIVDIVSVIMWIAAFFNGGESVAVLMMWSVYLANAVIMFVKWLKESKQDASKEVSL
ncbi:MAG: nicotinamide mononucleotide transporter [Lachnospira sp.]|nr:nicotinamide mononucleotide transporter [Lachnospira sp.]